MNDVLKRWASVAEANAAGVVPRLVDPRKRAKDARQAAAYRPCPCGSGKKFKFCCMTKG
jgi:uncharacterized protein YecA (UPF0149 family)